MKPSQDLERRMAKSPRTNCLIGYAPLVSISSLWSPQSFVWWPWSSSWPWRPHSSRTSWPFHNRWWRTPLQDWQNWSSADRRWSSAPSAPCLGWFSSGWPVVMRRGSRKRNERERDLQAHLEEAGPHLASSSPLSMKSPPIVSGRPSLTRCSRWVGPVLHAASRHPDQSKSMWCLQCATRLRLNQRLRRPEGSARNQRAKAQSREELPQARRSRHESTIAW